jgi:hypothetical protein
MVQIAMLVSGVATGLACKTWQEALRMTLVVFAVVLAVQTLAVASEDGFAAATDVVIYALIQAVSLAIGLGIARALVRRRDRRRVTA